MSKKVRLGIIILAAVLFIVFITTASLTFAKWSTGGGSSSQSTTYGPVSDSTNWSVYAKYFTYESVSGGIAITGFNGGNLEDIIIPDKINNQTVVSIKSIFSNTTQKSLPVTVKIPYTVTSISPSTFQNCDNLQTVTFGSYLSKSDNIIVCECGAYMFAGCLNLTKIYVLGNRKVKFGDYSFIGCNSLTTAPEAQTVYLKFKDGEDDTSYYINGSSSNIIYSELAKEGALFS